MTLLTILKIAGRYYYIILLIIIALLLRGFWNQKELAKDFKDVNELQYLELEQWKDKAGKNRARAVAAEIRAENVKEVLSQDLQKDLKEEIGNLKKNLISFSRVKAATQGQLQGALKDTVVVINDPNPVYAKSYSFRDKHIKLDALITPDSMFTKYQVYHNFDVTYYYKRPGKPPFNLFKKKRAVAEIKFENPGTQADSVYSILLERRRGFFKRLFE